MSGRRARPDAGDRDRRESSLAALAALYAEVDARFAGWSCEASTDCCHFGRTGREPYVTPIEAAALEQARARRGRKAAPAPTRTAERRSLPLASDERRCPLLDGDGRCTVYEARPLGCRTFFCDRASPGDKVTQRDINAFVARIRELVARFDGSDGTGRLLTRALGR